MVWEKLVTNNEYDIEKIVTANMSALTSAMFCPTCCHPEDKWKIADFWIAASQHPKNAISRFCRLALHAMYSCYKQ